MTSDKIDIMHGGRERIQNYYELAEGTTSIVNKGFQCRYKRQFSPMK
jgi:hypothetical protein